MKEQIKDGWQRVKAWVIEHRAVIILGSVALVASAITAVIVSRNSSHEKEGEEIIEMLDASIGEDEDDDYKEIDRYMIDTELMNKLPPGTYDVFDSYENERVDYVVEEKEG